MDRKTFNAGIGAFIRFYKSVTIGRGKDGEQSRQRCEKSLNTVVQKWRERDKDDKLTATRTELLNFVLE